MAGLEHEHEGQSSAWGPAVRCLTKEWCHPSIPAWATCVHGAPNSPNSPPAACTHTRLLPNPALLTVLSASLNSSGVTSLPATCGGGGAGHAQKSWHGMHTTMVCTGCSTPTAHDACSHICTSYCMPLLPSSLLNTAPSLSLETLCSPPHPTFPIFPFTASLSQPPSPLHAHHRPGCAACQTPPRHPASTA